jgi:hypothetical protein
MSDEIINGYKKGSNNDWIHIKSGIIRFTHPNHIGYCQHCDKSIIGDDDMGVKTTDDGDVLYCKKCFNEDKQLTEMLRAFMAKNKPTTLEKQKEKNREKETNDKFKDWISKEEKREKEADEKYKKLLEKSK